MNMWQWLQYLCDKFLKDISDRLDIILENQYAMKTELNIQHRLLASILRKEENMAADLAALTAQVQANTDLEASAVVLIKGIAAQLAAAATDPAAVAALAEQLRVSAQALGEAIVANTPAQPA